ncbi:Beta-1,4-mannooligosaccharide phosphorylase [Rubripirellula lacrimiformis]|uniref:Beta-1,4-mannooligosaccharide phosphorylase n=1 Tax=Rubripirellula lacrimiformis TaxID=1930273 RepID=A0A517NCX8_9BACT|nr:glycoside hydrolase family 130 protein [Rubripirellula lacrimiformis]QDT04908.1 Beta-1,4-mannooligosaccharide phosphorylase [Rubripirellula lacrimiformis]
MITRNSDSLLLEPCDITPSQPDWEVIGVFNPAVAAVDDGMVMLARVAERPSERRSGWTSLPRWESSGEPVVDWVRDEDLRLTDARVVALDQSGDLRLTSVSHLQIFRQSRSAPDLWEFVGRLLPEHAWEGFGIEDPRITKIDDTFWITYVAVSKSGAATALMSTKDFQRFKRHGIIFASENKDVVLFPHRIGGDYVAFHRPNPNSHFCAPQIWIARSPDLIHWGRHEPIVGGVQPWEGDRVGSGTPPVLTDEGWLMLYHGSATSEVAGIVGCYSAGACLFDRDDPTRVVARSREPIMSPTTEYETNGFVPNVVFPTALLDFGDDWQLFYGAADTCVAATRFSKQSISDSLLPMLGKP